MERRAFLKASGLTLGAAALSGAPLSSRLAAAPASSKTRHVMLIAFAGGVRSKETIGNPENVPNLMRLAERGVVYPNCHADNVGHYGATLSIFTGRTETFGIREQGRSDNPTIFEYLRAGARLPANAAWLSTTDGNQQVNLAHSNHPRYGARHGANLIAADGVFNAEFEEIVASFGKPHAPSDAESGTLDQLRGMLATPGTAGAAGAGAARRGARDAAQAGADSAANLREVERFVLDEISGRTTELTGPGASDAKALRVAGNILRVFKPAFLGVALQRADVAHGSFNEYVEIIRRNDAEVGKLLDLIDADAELRDSTAVFVVPEFGRDRDLNERNGLDHGDNSEDMTRVALVAAGPDFRRGRTARETVATIDVCPTICKLFGVRADLAKGSVLKGLFA